jgi:hypothetical protein
MLHVTDNPDDLARPVVCKHVHSNAPAEGILGRTRARAVSSLTTKRSGAFGSLSASVNVRPRFSGIFMVRSSPAESCGRRLPAPGRVLVWAGRRTRSKYPEPGPWKEKGDVTRIQYAGKGSGAAIEFGEEVNSLGTVVTIGRQEKVRGEDMIGAETVRNSVCLHSITSVRAIRTLKSDDVARRARGSSLRTRSWGPSNQYAAEPQSNVPASIRHETRRWRFGPADVSLISFHQDQDILEKVKRARAVLDAA